MITGNAATAVGIMSGRRRWRISRKAGVSSDVENFTLRPPIGTGSASRNKE